MPSPHWIMRIIAELIRQHHVEIVERWLEQARCAASARGLDRPELVNIMPGYVSSLGAEEGRQTTDERRKHVETHLGARIRQGFEIAEIVEEFALLGRCIASMWSASSAIDRPPQRELDELSNEIALASHAAVELFGAHMLHDEQTEKRYLRLLQSIASSALQPENGGLEGRIGELLALVMEAMAAQTAAFLVADADGNLVMVASIGAEEMEAYATTLDAQSFAAEIARHEDTTAVLDVCSTPLEVPAALRRSGIHALLGVRVPPHHGLVGVMYVGLAQQRAFSARETRRLESLAASLMLHLDNARLFAEVEDKVRALEAEQQLREQFVNVLAHDLRGPIAAARLGSELLLARRSVSPASEDGVRRVVQNLDRVDAMIRSLLDVSRIHAGESTPLDCTDCDLKRIVHNVVDDLTVEYPDRLLLDGDDAVLGTWSEDLVQRAVWNLASNALKYGDRDCVVAIAVTNTDRGARVTVHNWGTPIEDADKAALFEHFTRATNAVQKYRSGWGLGLALVRGCADAHGGSVTVTSDAATGTTFTMELPYQTLSGRGAADRPAIH